MSEVTVVLRCVCADPASVNYGGSPSILRAFRPSNAAPTSLDAEGDSIFTFELPADVESTNLRLPMPIHWELVVEGRTGWGEFGEVVPVPVYRVP